MQSVGTDGRVFQFLVLQLNTTDLASEEGIKNLVWVDSDQLLYQHFWCLPVIKKKVVVVSPAISGLVTGPGPWLVLPRESLAWGGGRACEWSTGFRNLTFRTSVCLEGCFSPARQLK